MKKYCMHCMQPLSESDVECPFCGKALEKEVPPHHLYPGTELKEKYVVGYAIGQGGFGITYVGWDKQLELKVAIKEYFPTGHVNRSGTVSPEVTCNPSDKDAEFFQKGRERFLEEARVLAKFAGEPGIVAVREYFEVNNTAYIVMNYLEGEDLKDYLKSHGVISVDETLELMMPVMKTLEKVHEQRLVHRDISPDNIRYTKGNLVLLDFGAARSVAAYSDKSMSVMLKPGYAPHEQYSSKGNQGEWTDVYALCATMYKCITGITPPEATSRYPEDTLKTPEALGFQIDSKIQAALMKGLSLMPGDRFHSVGELIRGLKGFIVETDQEDKPTLDNPGGADSPALGPGEPKLPGGDGPTIDPPKPKGPEEPKGPENPHPNKLWWKIALLVLAVLLVLGILIAAMVGIGRMLSERSENTISSLTPTPTVAEVEGPSLEPTPMLTPVPMETSIPSSIPTEEPENGMHDEATVVMSGDWMDFTFELEGVVYQLPCAYELFEDAGWSFDIPEPETYIVDGKSATNTRMYYGEKQVIVTLYNPSENKQSIKSCMVGAIKVQSKDVNFKIAKGIQLGMSTSDVTEAFGEPDVYTIDDYTSLSYKVNNSVNHSSNNRMEFMWYGDSVTSSIELKNYEKIERMQEKVNLNRPEYLDEYQIPTELGEDILSGIVSIEGELYQIPVPLGEFLDNGWEFIKKERVVETEVSGTLSGAYCILKKGDARIEVEVENFADYRTVVENCVVTEIRNLSAKDNVIIELPGGITFDSAREDVEKLLSSEWFIGEYSDRYLGYKYTMELLFVDKLKLSEVTVGGNNLERWAEQEILLPTPSPEPTPTPSPEPTPTETPVPVVEDEYAVGIAVKTHNNGDMEYDSWWVDSELHVYIESVTEELTSGQFFMSAYVPNSSLKDGAYGIEAFIQHGDVWEAIHHDFGGSKEFTIIDDKVMWRDEASQKVKTGYVMIFKVNYDFEETDKTNIVVKLHANTWNENCVVYFSNFYFVDKEQGKIYVDLTDEKYTVSAIHLQTRKELPVDILPGEYLWIYE